MYRRFGASSHFAMAWLDMERATTAFHASTSADCNHVSTVILSSSGMSQSRRSSDETSRATTLHFERVER